MQNKMSVEATTYRRRTERAEVKLVSRVFNHIVVNIQTYQ